MTRTGRVVRNGGVIVSLENLGEFAVVGEMVEEA